MNKYKFLGYFLIVVPFIVLLFFHNKVFLDSSLIPFFYLVVGFFPGLFYYRYGTTEKKPSKLVFSAFVLEISMIVILVVGSFLGYNTPGLEAIVIIVYTQISAFILYIISIILLIIYKIKKKEGIKLYRR